MLLPFIYLYFFFFNDPATTEIYTSVHTLSLHDALPIGVLVGPQRPPRPGPARRHEPAAKHAERTLDEERLLAEEEVVGAQRLALERGERVGRGAQKPSIACR